MSVRVVVPTLGERPTLLTRSLDSIVSQGVDLDLVLVGPSGVGLEQVARTYGGRLVADPRRGLSGALNAGLLAPPPDGTPPPVHVAWLGDDDLLAPGSLEATTRALEEHPDASMVFGWCDYIDADDRVVLRSRAGRVARAILTFGPDLVPQPGSLMRYADVRAVGGVDESLRFAMDLDLFLKLRRRGRLLVLPRTLAAFRWHADSTTVSNEKGSMDEADRVRSRHLPAAVAPAYDRVLRWPGRWALVAAKRWAGRG